MLKRTETRKIILTGTDCDPQLYKYEVIMQSMQSINQSITQSMNTFTTVITEKTDIPLFV